MKKLIVLFLLLFAINVQADEYVDDIADAVIRVKMNIGWATTTDNVYDSVIAGYVREGLLLISMATKGNLLFDTVVTTQFTHFIAYDTLIEIVSDATFFNRDSIKQLLWVPRDQWENLEAVDNYLSLETEWDDRLPKYYDWNRGFLFLKDVPAISGDSILIIGFAKPSIIIALFWDGDVSFSDTTDCTDACDSVQYLALMDIAVIHRPAAVYYATALLATRLGLPSAQMWDAKFKEYIQVMNATINRKEYNAQTN